MIYTTSVLLIITGALGLVVAALFYRMVSAFANTRDERAVGFTAVFFIATLAFIGLVCGLTVVHECPR